MDSNNSNFDFSKMANMLELVKSISSSNNVPEPQYDTLEIDNVVNSQEMNVIKAAIPYMNPEVQKKLAVFVKFLEFTKTMNLYNNYAVTEISELNKSALNKQDMLYAIRSQCSEKNRNVLDIILNMYTLKSLISAINNPDQHQVPYNPNNNQENKSNENLNQDELIDKLKHLINDNS